MKLLTIVPLKSVNGLNFGSTRADSRKIFGNKFEEFPRRIEETPAEKAQYEEIAKMMADMAGKSVEDFLAEVPSVPEAIFDSYNEFHICFAENYRIEAIEIFTEAEITLKIGYKSYSGINTSTYLTLAPDFEWSEIDTAYISYSRQISLYCPENKNKVESILFGCPGYYKKEK